MSTCEAEMRCVIGQTLPSLPQAKEGVLDPAETRAVIRIAPYAGMASGDRLLLCWSGLDTDGIAYRREFSRSVSERQVGADTVVIVSGEHIDALDGGSLEIYFTLQSARMTGPARSRSLHLSIGDVRADLLPARVPAAVGGSLDPARMPDGTLVSIRPYARMAAGDRVCLSWTGATCQASLTDVLVVESFALGEELSFWITPDLIGPHLNRTVTVAYTVQHGNGVIRSSEPAELLIGPLKRGILAAPTILEADGDWLDLEDAAEGVTIVISDANVQKGEWVYLKCDGEQFSHRDHREITEATAGESLVFVVPYTFWREHHDSTVRIACSIERLDDVSQASEVALLRVRS